MAQADVWRVLNRRPERNYLAVNAEQNSFRHSMDWKDEQSVPSISLSSDNVVSRRLAPDFYLTKFDLQHFGYLLNTPCLPTLCTD